MRRYTPAEMREIMKLAQELREPGRGASGESVTLAEMQSVATEIGLDPSKVALAAAQYDAGRRVGEKRNRWVHHFVRQLPFRVGDVGWERVVDQMEAYVGITGTIRDRADGSQEWTSANNGERIITRLSHDGSSSRIEINVNRGESKAILTVLWSICFFLSLIVGLGASSKQGISVTEFITVLTILGAEVGLLLTMFNSSQTRAERRFKDLADQIEAAATSDQTLYSSAGPQVTRVLEEGEANRLQA
ncbi:MAG: hypothetical protein ACAH95_11365 [Fimbriimonas sp.]